MVMQEAASVGRQAITKSDVQRIAASFGIQAEEIHEMLRRFTFDPNGGRAEVQVELKLSGGHSVPGHLDHVQQHSADHYEVTDYKTTHQPQEEPEPWEHPQLLAYGVAFWDEYILDHEAGKVTVALAFPRLGDERGWSQHDLDAVEVRAARALLEDIVQRAAAEYDKPPEKRDYQIGTWCQYCPGRVKCPALAAEVQAAFNLISHPEVTEVTKDNAVGLYSLRTMLTRTEKVIARLVRAIVDQHGPLDSSPGKELRVETQLRRPSLNVDVVRRALSQCGVPVEQIDAVLMTIEARPRESITRMGFYKKEADTQ